MWTEGLCDPRPRLPSRDNSEHESRVGRNRGAELVRCPAETAHLVGCPHLFPRHWGPFARRTPPYLGDLTLTADYAGRIGSEQGVVRIRVVGGCAVEKQHVGEVCKAFTRVGWIQCT